MLLYCLRCRKNAVSKNPRIVKIRNERIMLSSNYVVFDTKKLGFIK